MAAETTTVCDELQPWLAAYALGEAEPEPDALAHLAGCLRCQHDLAEYRAVAGLLPYAAPQHEPAPALRARLIAAVEQAAPAPHTNIAPAPPTPLRRPRWQPASRSAWAAYAFAALALALLGWNISLRSQITAQSAELSFHRQTWQSMVALLNDDGLHWYNVTGEQAHGHVWLTDQSSVACLVAQQLPPLAIGQVYQVWLDQHGTPISGGTFEAHDGSGWVLVQADEPIAQYQAVYVTIEPAGGSPTPTGQRVLAGSASAGITPATDRSELQKLLVATFNS